MRLTYVTILPAVIGSGLIALPAAAADCTSAAGTTVCSQGDVRGANTGQGPGAIPTYNPYQCWYCNNGGWGLTFIIERPHRPHGDGGGGRRG
ncbi:hypothetical protein [Mycobacterium kyogaense]|uniref:hypothetical protein n=1 Tax=Mycobacterium kyogaense TaxID=2212479 RepID=UPI000DAE0084|nr:hypothetical protein [Mycobacterium kyogaense]